MNLTSQKMIYLRESAKLSKSYRATKALFIRNLIKVNTTVLISRQDKLNEDQVLDNLNNYRPLDKPPMVKLQPKKLNNLLKHCSQKATLIKRRLNGSPLRPILRESPCFTHLLKSTNQHLSEDLLYQGVPDLQNGSQHKLTTLFSQ